MDSGAARHALLTGGAVRVGRILALALARAGWDILLHYRASRHDAQALAREIEALGRRCTLVQADFEDAPEDVAARLIAAAPAPLTALIHNASLFDNDDRDPTGERHGSVNVAVPLALNAAFVAQLPEGVTGTIVQILDATPMPPHKSAYTQSRAAMENLLPELAARYAPRARLYSLPLGPVLKNPRQTATHFAALQASAATNVPCSPEEAANSLLVLLEKKR